MQKIPDSAVVRIIDVTNGREIQRIEKKSLTGHANKGGEIWEADFSALKRTGQYRIMSGVYQSTAFKVGSNVYAPLLRSLLRAYFLQRCGVELQDTETGLVHPACHMKDGVLFRTDKSFASGTQLNCAGGWHDAGDFGKYLATTSVAIGEILSLYERHPSIFFDGQLGIPESGNGHADVLDEMIVGLNWMLTMQRPDGAVYRKLSGAEWPKPDSPDRDQQRRYVYGISSKETAKYCAVMAVAARVLQPEYSARATEYLNAAEAAWDYLSKTPNMVIDCEPADNTGSGAYLANNVDREETLLHDIGDRAWAGAEMYLATGDVLYLDAVQKYVELGDFGLFEWKNPAPLGLQNLLHSGKIDRRLEKKLRRLLRERANRLSEDARTSPWGLSNRKIIWGSNKIAAANGSCLAAASEICDFPEFRNYAVRQLDYVLGVNPLAQCFVTGAGTNSVEHVDHLYARGVQMDIPGLLVGGPNNDAQDKIAPGGLGLLSYLDDERSYSTNEFAIDYNSSLIGLIGSLLGLSGAGGRQPKLGQ